MKVQDGCLLRCSFCIIPYVRPQLTSRPIEHILDEVRRLVDNGYREVVLTGIHLGHYGVDWNRQRTRSRMDSRLSHLVAASAALPGDFRVRLSSIEATEVTRELIDVMADHPDKVCSAPAHLHAKRQRRRPATDAPPLGQPAFHRPLPTRPESGSTAPRITTDIIVGFPGETDAEFAATCRTARAAGFSKIHIFPFSPRKGTPAAEFPDKVTAAVKLERVRQLTELERQLQDEFFRSLTGRRLRAPSSRPAKRDATMSSARHAATRPWNSRGTFGCAAK